MFGTISSKYRKTCARSRVALFCAGLIFAVCVRPAVPAPDDSPDRGSGPTRVAPQPFTIGKTGAVPGTRYSIDTSTPGDVEYLAGDLPLIISVPHGGGLKPGIPDRRGSWGFINTNDDDATIELASDIVRAIREKTGGKYPHVIINNLARATIDQNRDWGRDNNPVAGRGGVAWKDFHDKFIGSVAVPAVLKDYGSGLFIDLHGKPDGYGADIIIGYNLTAAELSNSDRHLNTGKKAYADRSSIRFLSKKLDAKIAFADLLRGNIPGHESFGSLLQKQLDAISRARGKHYSAVPRHDLKKPLLNLSGGYNIRQYCGVKDGSFDNPYGYTASRFISGFQVEVSRSIRVKDARLRGEFARALADAAITCLERNFGIRITPARVR